MSSLFDKLRGRAQRTVEQHGDKITQGLDRAAAEADKRTKGKYRDRIARGRSKAQDALDKLEDREDPGSTGGGPEQPRP